MYFTRQIIRNSQRTLAATVSNNRTSMVSQANILSIKKNTFQSLDGIQTTKTTALQVPPLSKYIQTDLSFPIYNSDDVEDR